MWLHENDRKQIHPKTSYRGFKRDTIIYKNSLEYYIVVKTGIIEKRNKKIRNLKILKFAADTFLTQYVRGSVLNLLTFADRLQRENRGFVKSDPHDRSYSRDSQYFGCYDNNYHLWTYVRTTTC